jgi:metacaspase-1
MKYTICLLVLLCGLSQGFSQKPVKRALIIAIGDYPESLGWPQLSSMNDIPYIKNVLTNQDFQPENITVVSDKDATIEGIKKAFEDLIASVKPGDVVVIHFSCHGEQVEADNNNKIDGLDECIVTYNAMYPLKSHDFQKDQAQYLRGHVIGSYLKRLRTAAGSAGDVIVFMDNCHSGSGTRGVAKVRGNGPPFVSETFDPKNHFKADSSVLSRMEGGSGMDESKMATYEVISATRPEENDNETTDDKGAGVGSLTYAISKAFEDVRAGKTTPTYRTLFARILITMNETVSGQQPMLEGNGIDRQLFAGAFKHQLPYIEISKLENDHQIIIKRGIMGGLDTGAKIAVYPAGTVDTAGIKPLATGTIINSGNFLSTASLDASLDFHLPAEGFVFVTEYAYNIKPFTINFAPAAKSSPGFSAQDIATLKKNMAGLSFLKIDDNPELLFVKGKNEDSIKLSSNGFLFQTVKNSTSDSVGLTNTLESYARYKYLQTLSASAKGLSISVQLVPYYHGKADTSRINSRMINNSFVTYDQDTVALWIKNTGTEDAWLNILDMQPNGIINPVLPNQQEGIHSADLKVLAGQESLVYKVTVSPPFGTEVYKIFVSRTEIDMENIATTKGAASRGGGRALSSLENLVSKSYTLSRGTHSLADQNADATITDLLFQIKPGPKP